MNTDNNKRFQQTEEKILRTFGQLAIRKGLEKVTVSDVCREAGIHRTTFYGHYEDIVALRRIAEQYPARMVLARMQAEQRWDVRTGIMEMLTFYQANRQIILRSLTNARFSSGRVLYLPETGFPDYWSSEYLVSYAQFFHCDSPENARYHRTAFESGIQAVAQKWLLDGCKEKPEEIVEILAGIYRF